MYNARAVLCAYDMEKYLVSSFINVNQFLVLVAFGKHANFWNYRAITGTALLCSYRACWFTTNYHRLHIFRNIFHCISLNIHHVAKFKYVDLNGIYIWCRTNFFLRCTVFKENLRIYICASFMYGTLTKAKFTRQLLVLTPPNTKFHRYPFTSFGYETCGLMDGQPWCVDGRDGRTNAFLAYFSYKEWQTYNDMSLCVLH
jgi:hypothetical protein